MSTTDSTCNTGGPRDARGYRRSIATTPGYHVGRAPKNKGRRYPAEPPTSNDMVTLLGACAETPAGIRQRALMAVMWRTGLRIAEALALVESDLDPHEKIIVVRRGKGGKRRIVGMDDWGWAELAHWMDLRNELPPGEVFCVAHGPTAGRALNPTAVRLRMRKLCVQVGMRKRVSPHQLRHAHAIDLVGEGFDFHAIMRQLGHSNLAVTGHYLSGISGEDNARRVAQRTGPTVQIAHRRPMSSYRYDEDAVRAACGRSALPPVTNVHEALAALDVHPLLNHIVDVLGQSAAASLDEVHVTEVQQMFQISVEAAFVRGLLAGHKLRDDEAA